MAQCALPDAEYPLGLVIDRQFRLEELIGEGSMAHVYRAHQLGVGRDVALKVLRRKLLTQPEIVARFREEAALVARLEHPHVVVVHGVGEMPPAHPASPSEPSASEPYVVLELLHGRSLTQALEESGGRLPLSRALHVILALADAVGEAHARGIVHRDLKPDNVMLVERGKDRDFVKLLDFGLAKVLSENRDIRTRAGAILGTPSYVSPEGAQGLAVSPASDCYALATLLYRCLSGQLPFAAPSAVTVLAQKASQAAPELRSLPGMQELPDGIAELVMQNLARKPEQRASDARVFGQSLIQAARRAGLEAQDFGWSQTLTGTLEAVTREQITAAREVNASVPAPAASRPPAPVANSQRPPLSLIGIVLGCFLVGALVAAAWGLWSGSSSPEPRDVSEEWRSP